MKTIFTLKLGNLATPSAIADLALYGSEMKHQGDVFLGSMADAMAALAKIRQTPEFKDIAEGSGFMIDGVLTDMASRSQVGDNLSRDMTKVQRTFLAFFNHVK